MDGLFLDVMNYLLSFPFAKLLYSLLLASIILIGISELHRLWIDRTLEVQVFKYMVERTPKEDEGTAFTWGLIEEHNSLRERFREAELEDIDAEAKYRTKTDSPIKSTENVLSELNITVSQFNVTAFLSYLQRWVSAPKELRGLVTKEGDIVKVSADISGSHGSLANGQSASNSIRLTNLESKEAVFETACHLIWLSAAAEQKEIADIGRDEFCLWTKYWRTFLDIRDKSRRNGSVSAEDAKALDALTGNITAQIDRKAKYIRFRDLRADLREFQAHWENDAGKKQAYRVAAQRDHFDYLRNLNADMREGVDLNSLRQNPNFYNILAAMRPALPVNAENSFDYSSLEKTDKLLTSGGYARFWKYALENADSVKTAARSMGLARLGKSKAEESPLGPIRCFAIAKNLVATAGYNFDPKTFDLDVPPPYWFDIPQNAYARFWFAKSASETDDENKGLAIKRVLVLGGGASDLVLFEIDGHDDALNPPIALDATGTEADAAGEFIAVLGYPEFDARLPEEFVKALLGDKGGILRVMPGRSTVQDTTANTRTLEGLRLQFEASTTGGTGGTPVIGLHSGKLVGISMTGQFDEAEMLKRGSALRTSDLVSREPFKSALTANANPLDLAFASLVTGIQRVEPGATTPVAPDVPDQPDAPRKGYDAEFLGTQVPLPKLRIGSGATQRLDYEHFSVVMYKPKRMAALAAANIDGEHLVKLGRDSASTERFLLDKRLPSDQQIDNRFYAELRDIDRGTLLRRQYVTWGNEIEARAAHRDWFFLPGVVPQHAKLNQRSWSDLERYVYDYIAANGKKAIVIAGPVFSDGDPAYKGVQIPGQFWKILVIADKGTLRTAAYLLFQKIELGTTPNKEISAIVSSFDSKLSRTTVRNISGMTDLDFGPLLNAAEIE